IIITLLQNGKTKAKDLASKYEVSIKTIYRYIDALTLSAVPIISTNGRDGGIEIGGNFTLDKLYFSKEELSTIISSLNSTSLEEFNNSSLVEKITFATGSKELELMRSECIVFDTLPWYYKSSFQQKINTLKTNIKLRQITQIEYTGLNKKNTTRKIEPYLIIFKDGVFYLYAFCLLKNEFRLFRLSRISSIVTLGEKFIKREIDYKNKPWSENTKQNLESIELIVSNEILPEITDWLGDNSTIKKYNDKNSCVSFISAINVGLQNKLLSFGSNIVVTAPNQLKAKLASEIKKMDILYS
ncbi:MAG: WYL domain-containing protein, partial [Clostridia bacterium]